MAVFAIALNEPNAEVWEKVKESWPNSRHYIVSDTLAFVSGNADETLTADVTKTIGLGVPEKSRGVVMQLGYYHGFNAADLWEWIGKNS